MYSSGELWSYVERGEGVEIIDPVSQEKTIFDPIRVHNTFFPPLALVDSISLEPVQGKNEQQKTVNINSNIIREDIPRL